MYMHVGVAITKRQHAEASPYLCPSLVIYVFAVTHVSRPLSCVTHLLFIELLAELAHGRLEPLLAAVVSLLQLALLLRQLRVLVQQACKPTTAAAEKRHKPTPRMTTITVTTFSMQEHVFDMFISCIRLLCA